MLEVVPRCVRWKQKVVAEDPKEQGIRALLNYGHTIGHALEAATGYQTYLHGEAVAIGMHGAARIAHHLGILGQEAFDKQQAVIAQYALPLQYTQVDPAAIHDAISLDKKNRQGKVRWILLDDIGTPRIEERSTANACAPSHRRATGKLIHHFEKLSSNGLVLAAKTII